jgi:hypothetical protein
MLLATRFEVDAALVLCGLNLSVSTPALFRNCLHQREIVYLVTAP